MTKLQSWTRCTESALRGTRVVFTDVDDTLTSDGMVEEEAFSAIWALHRAGIAVVPVTGRPAGWCDHLARMWPVAGVVGENGAFYFCYDRDKRKFVRRFAQSRRHRHEGQAKLAKVRDRILRGVKGAGIASDQDFRLHDLAIDFCEDVKPLSQESVARIVELFHEAGMTAKVSSIHVNGWFGRYDKLKMMRRFAKEVLSLDIDDGRAKKRAFFVGDSPNDEPAFAFFADTSVGVANVARFLGDLHHPPAWITTQPGGRGFQEVADRILKAKRAPKPKR